MTPADIDALIKRFRNLINTEIGEVVAVINSGNLPDYVSYKEQCARLRTLEFTLEGFQEILKKLSQEEED